MNLVANAKYWYKMLSVQVALLFSALTALPSEQYTALLAFLHIPPQTVPATMAFFFILGRMVSQPAINPPADAPKDQ